jgi:hypothetical protein
LGNEYGFDSEYGGFLAEAISGLAAVAAARGQDRTAATLSGIAEATGERHEPSVARRLDERFFAEARARLGKRTWQEAHAAGYALDVDHAIGIALRGAQRVTYEDQLANDRAAHP